MKREPNFPSVQSYARKNITTDAEIAEHKERHGFTDLGDFAPKPRPVHRDCIKGVSPKPKREKAEQASKPPTYGPTAKTVYQHLLEYKEIREGDCGFTRKQISQAVGQLRTAGIKGIETVRVELPDGAKINGSLKVDYYKLQA